jgi:hypothetical protein
VAKSVEAKRWWRSLTLPSDQSIVELDAPALVDINICPGVLLLTLCEVAAVNLPWLHSGRSAATFPILWFIAVKASVEAANFLGGAPHKLRNNCMAYFSREMEAIIHGQGESDALTLY